MEGEPDAERGDLLGFLTLRKAGILPALAVAGISGCTGCSSVGYLARTSIGQWRLFNRARPVEEVLRSPYTPESSRQGILLVQEAKRFAAAELGLRATRNYESFVQLDAPCVSWAVSASHPLELREKKWRFPVVGEIPYLGFFTKAEAEAEARRIEAEESPKPDTWVRCVPAYSSLGWFSDPLYSSMLGGKEHQVVDLVVHESLHATVWVGGSVDFNEKLANFVGLEGSVRYMEKRKGAAGVEEVRAEVAGAKLFAEFMQASMNRYRAEVRSLDDKNAFYRGLPGAYAKLLAVRGAEKGGRIAAPAPRLESWNNAALLAYGNYFSDYSVFEGLLASCGADLGRFVAWIASLRSDAEFERQPEARLRAMAAAKEKCPTRP